MNFSINLEELGKQFGTPPSMKDIAEKIGFTERPIDLSKLAEAVQTYLKRDRNSNSNSDRLG